MFTLQGEYSSALITIDNIDQQTISQIYSFLNHKAFTNPIAIMPDTHAGKGSVIGFTMPMTTKVIPNVIGVDGSCGMLSFILKNNILEKISKEELESKIREVIPMGTSVHRRKQFSDFNWKSVKEEAKQFAQKYQEKFGINIHDYIPDYNPRWFSKKCDEIGMNEVRALNSIGTMGSGNHFLEIGETEEGKTVITIHSGSRQFGKEICEYWQKRKYLDLSEKKNELESLVKKIKEEAKTQVQKTQISQKINEAKLMLEKKYGTKSQLDYLEGEAAYLYLFDMIFVHEYASLNRKVMMNSISKVIEMQVEEEIETVHNYINFRDLIIRKGAISAYKDEKLIIPFTSEVGLLICRGKENPEWNYSAPHGAGRILSRKRANEELSVDVYRESLEKAGVYTTHVGKSTLDEAPQAYKDPKLIEEAIKPTVEILHRVRPVINFKSKST